LDHEIETAIGRYQSAKNFILPEVAIPAGHVEADENA
jgi:hypothetical protein